MMIIYSTILLNKKNLLFILWIHFIAQLAVFPIQVERLARNE